MANIVPGAIWSPIDVGNRAARRKGRGLIGHVAVSNSVKLVPGPLASRAADWHFYLPKDPQPGGRFYQFIDLDKQCWSSAAGNATCPAFESQGGMGTSAQVNAEPWTDNQVESAAMILAHLHRTEGVPLQDMVNSLPTSRGFGVHRYGINPWRVAGGEVWSSSTGKLCPGDAKVRQVGQIVARAQQLVNGEDDMPLSDDDLRKVYEAVWFGIAGARLIPNLRRDPNGTQGEWPYTTLGAMDGRIQNEILPAALAPIIAALADRPDVQVQQQPATVDPEALAAALLADDTAVQKLGDAIAAGLARRVSNG
jgi:hypothetical protein